MRRVTWSQLTEFDYDKNIDFILKRWGFHEAEEFVTRVEEIILNLKKGTVSYQSSIFKGLKKCVVSKRIILYYRVKSINETELVRFWNTYKDDN